MAQRGAIHGRQICTPGVIFSLLVGGALAVAVSSLLDAADTWRDDLTQL